MFDLHILIIFPKHASFVLFIFAKECQSGRLLEIFLIIILGKNKSHVLQQKNSVSQLWSHKFVDQAV